jgi:hypothetical protein
VSGGSGGGGNQILLDGDDFGLSVRCLLNYEI